MFWGADAALSRSRGYTTMKRRRRIGDARGGRAPNVTQRVNATIYKYTPHELQAAKGTLEWWTTIFSEPSDARRYWNVYSTFVSLPSVPVK